MHQNTPVEPEKKLSAKQMQAIASLASGSTIDAAAAKVGCDQSTIDRWKKQPEFMAALHRAQDDIYNESLAVLKGTAKDAIACLVRNMGEEVSPYVQVQAASKLLDIGMEVHKMSELEQKIAEIEQFLKDREP